MPEQVQRCKQCGELKTYANFRRYYGGRKSHYKVCKLCERINNRFKYLNNKELKSEAEQLEFDKIAELYEMLRAQGLQPPRFGKEPDRIIDDVDAMLNKHRAYYEQIKAAEAQIDIDVPDDIPEQLLKWLTAPLDGYEPEFLLENTYEELQSMYRPQIGVDEETMLPIYDDKYRDVLRAILDRFNEYEDEYYNK